MPAVRLGLIGCGWIAAAHLRAIQERRHRCALVWAADPDVERAEHMAAQAGCAALTRYEEGLADVDAVIIATPHHLHADMARTVAGAGKHILLEKPLATTLEDADAILAAVAEAGVTLLVGYTRHYQPEFRRLRALVETGRYGRLCTVSASMLEHVEGYLGGWMAQREQLGGGCFFSAGGHPLEWLVSLAGPVMEIYAVTERFAVPMEGEDTAIAALRFAGGAVGAITQSWCQPNSSTWMSVSAGCTRGILELAIGHMTGGPSVWEWSARLTEQVGHQEHVLYEGPAGFEFTPQLDHFLDCVSGQAQPETGGAYARALMAATLQAYETGGGRIHT